MTLLTFQEMRKVVKDLVLMKLQKDVTVSMKTIKVVTKI